MWDYTACMPMKLALIRKVTGIAAIHMKYVPFVVNYYGA